MLTIPYIHVPRDAPVHQHALPKTAVRKIPARHSRVIAASGRDRSPLSLLRSHSQLQPLSLSLSLFSFSLSSTIINHPILHQSHYQFIPVRLQPGSKNIHLRWAFTLIPGHEPPSSLWFANCASISTPGALLCGQRKSSNKHLALPLFFPLVNTSIAFFSLRNLRPIAFDSVDPLAGAVALSAVFPDLPRASPSAS